MAPAAAISRTPHRVALAESLLLLATRVIFGALIVLGGIEGTGLFWIYTVTFLAFFLALVTLYMAGVSPMLYFSYRYTPVVSTHFLLSFGCYTLAPAQPPKPPLESAEIQVMNELNVCISSWSRTTPWAMLRWRAC